MDINSKLEAIRSKMKTNGIDAYIIGTADPHQSEYPPSFWAGRQWISGFDGSAGTVIISQDHAGLWTDSRYFQQAELQLAHTSFVLHKLQVQTQSEYIDWICNEFKAGQTVGVDFWCFSLNQIHQFDKLLSAKGIKFKDCGDLLMDIWTDRPPLSKTLIYEHD
ncbi:MAG: aminopeptidase P family N-terminal domain-containing protein, partial [Saprospiraceae bacterium]